MAAIKKYTNNKSWRGCAGKGTLLHHWKEWKLTQSLWRAVWRCLKKLEIEPPYDPTISLLAIYTKETRIEIDTCTPVFIVALFPIARTWRQPRCPSVDEWIRKLWFTYTMEILLSYNKECIWVSSNELEKTRSYYAEWSKSEREIPLKNTSTHVWNLERW